MSIKKIHTGWSEKMSCIMSMSSKKLPLRTQEDCIKPNSDANANITVNTGIHNNTQSKNIIIG
jgi:hypothetical protein